jgi:periplasmic divalent cation tolerance protein
MTTIDYVTVTTTTDNEDEATRLAETAVTARLAACAQISNIASTYWWQGKVETAEEYRIDYKTAAALAERLTAHLKSVHSYDTPEVIVTPILGGNPAYLDWISAETVG